MRILCLILSLSCSPIEKAVERNVVVETDSIMGSGVVIETNRILTNYHLLKSEDGELTVDHKMAKVIAFNKDADLALIVAPTKKFKRLELRRPNVGQKVFYVGNPTGHIGAVSQGYVVYKDQTHTATDLVPLPGMSGGGLYNYKGQLVGLNFAMEGQPGVGMQLAVHVPIEVVERFLKEHLK